MLPDFLGQAQRDFEMISSGDFAEEITISDGSETITIRAIFDSPTESFDPDSNSFVARPEYSVIVAETATTFNLRRAGLAFTIRGQAYTSRQSDWRGDGLGQLHIYLDKA